MSFQSEVEAWTKKAKSRTQMVLRETIDLANERLVMQTPVGDPSLWVMLPAPDYTPGTLRANWNFGIGTPDGSVDYTIRDTSGAATMDAIQAKIPDHITDGAYFITNSVHYMRKIEFGWSSQAPAGVVRITAAALPVEVRRYIASFSA